MTQWAQHHDTYSEGPARVPRPQEGTRLDHILAELKARPRPSFQGLSEAAPEFERNVTPLNTPYRTEFQSLQASIDQLADRMDSHRLAEAIDELSAKVSALHADRSLGESELRLLRSIRRSLDDVIYQMNNPAPQPSSPPQESISQSPWMQPEEERGSARAAPDTPPSPIKARPFGRRLQRPEPDLTRTIGSHHEPARRGFAPFAIDNPLLEPARAAVSAVPSTAWAGRRIVSQYPMASVAAAALFALALAQGVSHVSPRLNDMTGSIRTAPAPQAAASITEPYSAAPPNRVEAATHMAAPPSLTLAPTQATAPVQAAPPAPLNVAPARAPEEISGMNAYAAGIRLADGPARDYRGAIQMFEKAGDVPAAQFRLALLYERGQGAAKNPGLARGLYQRAAERGHVRAMHNLGVLYADGVDGKPDYTLAAEWFRRAAEYGLRDSQYNLATLTARGLGTSKNPALAYQWFALAAAQGDADAGRQRDEIGKTLDAQSLRSAKANIEAFRPKPTDPVINQMASP